MIPAAVVEAFMSQSSTHLSASQARPSWRQTLWSNWLRVGWIGLGIGLAIAMWSIHYSVVLNATPSLPHTLYVVAKGTWPTQVGDLVAYRSTGHGPLPAGITVVKRVVGMPGDLVTKDLDARQRERVIVRSALPSGQVQTFEQSVKPLSRSFKPLQSGPEGVIPTMHYHVSGDHADSFDSRYALMGWVRADQVAGKVVWAW